MANNTAPVIPLNQSTTDTHDKTTSASMILPRQGMSRASQILPFLPFGSTTLWKWSREGLFPAPIRISPTITAWRNSDVLDWLEAQGNHNTDKTEEV